MKPIPFLLILFLGTCLAFPSISSAERTANGSNIKRHKISKQKKTKRKTKKGVRAPRKVGKNKVGQKVEEAPIYKPFLQVAERQCRCTPVGVGTWGARGNKSCHPQGRAIDVRGANCDGKVSYAVSPGFSKFVQCMAAKGWFKLYNGQCVKGLPKNKTTCHKDHAHFSKCCQTNRGKAC